MGKSMEERKKAGPFGPRWQKVKGQHKALSSGKLFKPDLGPIAERYDQTLKDHDEILKQQDKLKQILQDFAKQNGDSTKERDRINSDIQKNAAKFDGQAATAGSVLSKYASGGGNDFKAVVSALESATAAAEEFVNSRSRLFDELDAHGKDHLKYFKKVNDDFSSQAGDLDAQVSKCEAAADAAESEITSTLQDYIGIADDADHPEIVKSLKSLKV